MIKVQRPKTIPYATYMFLPHRHGALRPPPPSPHPIFPTRWHDKRKKTGNESKLQYGCLVGPKNSERVSSPRSFNLVCCVKAEIFQRSKGEMDKRKIRRSREEGQSSGIYKRSTGATHVWF